MKGPIKKWHDEHAQFARLLDYLAAEMTAFHDGGDPDYDLIADIVQYLKEYSACQHHQREDVAFSLLAKRDPTLAPLVKRLAHEHRVIDNVGSSFHELLVCVLNDGVISREALESAAATYLVYYRAHIESEESQVLPAAARLLTESDWKAVADAVPSAPDPLFGAEVGLTYRVMRAQLLADATAPD
ncbi:MAG: hemerythrin domain-containing protein [Burkholderiaceae bacterium]|nr:hemerythrin domain-containing protein [Burkholderiaceae bacterium]